MGSGNQLVSFYLASDAKRLEAPVPSALALLLCFRAHNRPEIRVWHPIRSPYLHSRSDLPRSFGHSGTNYPCHISSKWLRPPPPGSSSIFGPQRFFNPRFALVRSYFAQQSSEKVQSPYGPKIICPRNVFPAFNALPVHLEERRQDNQRISVYHQSCRKARKKFVSRVQERIQSEE